MLAPFEQIGHHPLLLVFSFLMGACIGSFLNVVIYRLPEGLSVWQPARSFCPNCKTQIPAWLNIPLVTWLMLGGKCKWCKGEIKFRYFMVELLTAICFLAIWFLFIKSGGMLVVVCLWLLAALLISATFVDFDHMIIPDTVSLGGLGAGIILSTLVPKLHGKSEWLDGLIASAMGAGLGYFLLWTVYNLGKLIFGQLKHSFEKPLKFSISQPGGEDTPILFKMGKDLSYEWHDIFNRPTDRMELQVTALKIDFLPEKDMEPIERDETELVYVRGETLEVDGEIYQLEGMKRISGKTLGAVVPREAMGRGDLKFIAMIGAFQGWQAVLITLIAASMVGAIIGSIQKFASKESCIPFGPYLALGSFIFLFTGTAIWDWYMSLFRG